MKKRSAHRDRQRVARLPLRPVYVLPRVCVLPAPPPDCSRMRALLRDDVIFHARQWARYRDLEHGQFGWGAKSWRRHDMTLLLAAVNHLEDHVRRYGR